MNAAAELGDSLRVIKRRLSPKDRIRLVFSVSRVGGRTIGVVLYRDYSHGSRTKFRSPRLRGYPAPPPSNVRARPSSARFTISNYNDYVDLLRGELSFLSARCLASQKEAQRRDDMEQHREELNWDWDSPNSLEF